MSAERDRLEARLVDRTAELLAERENIIELDDYLSDREPPPIEAYSDETTADNAARSSWPAPLDVGALLGTPAEQPSMLIPDWLPAGYATLLAGHGGAGKSSIALRLAVCIALGRPWFGLPCEQRRVLYLSCEDRASVVHWRLRRIADAELLTTAEQSALAGALSIVDLVGHDSMLYQRHPHGSGIAPSFAELTRLLRETRAQVLFVDGVADTYGASENDRAEVKQFVNTLVQLIGVDGAVVLVAHVNKPTATAGASSEGYSGSTGWHNSARARWYLYPETEHTDDGMSATGALVLALQKTNLGRDDQAIRLRWDNDAHLFEAEAGASRFDARVRDTAEQRGIVDAIREVIASGDYVPAAAQGPRTALHVLSACSAFPAELKNRSGKRRFWRHVEALRRNRTLREGRMRRASRHDVAILELEPAP
jgi:RecA-family ATPase